MRRNKGCASLSLEVTSGILDLLDISAASNNGIPRLERLLRQIAGMRRFRRSPAGSSGDKNALMLIEPIYSDYLAEELSSPKSIPLSHLQIQHRAPLFRIQSKSVGEFIHPFCQLQNINSGKAGQIREPKS